MRTVRVVSVAGVLMIAAGLRPPAHQQAATRVSRALGPSGVHDFDFLVGEWRVRHRVKREENRWTEFEGTASNRPLMDGKANVEEHVLNKPSGVLHAVALRAYDPNTGQWAIWWLDERYALGPLDPPVKGAFDHGVGTFYADDSVNGKPRRTRFTWSQITATSARWEQAFSLDTGRTWETNWIMEFQRASTAR